MAKSTPEPLAPLATPPLSPLAERSHCAMAECEDVFVVLWRGAYRSEDLEFVSASIQPWARRAGPGGGAILSIIERGIGMPDESFRREATNLRGVGRGIVRAMAVVYEATGFESAAQRAAQNSVSLAAGHPFPQRAFSDVESACAWIDTQRAIPRSSRRDAHALARAVSAWRANLATGQRP